MKKARGDSSDSGDEPVVSPVTGNSGEDLNRVFDQVLEELRGPREPYRLDLATSARVSKLDQKLRDREMDRIAAGLMEIVSSMPNPHKRYSEREVGFAFAESDLMPWTAESIRQLIDLLTRIEIWLEGLDLSTISDARAKQSIDALLDVLGSRLSALRAQIPNCC
jgi:hypothetical protein